MNALPVPTKQTHLTHPKYRTDIDGLRAIAILSVVGFHAFPNWIQGGFVGVDIFFVISGFLISSIIISSLEKDTFSFTEFYARRIKRIFPALILIMTACYIFGWFALLPDEFKQLGKHIAAGAGFVSNLIFWQEAGYFDNAAQTKPLLHLWSLGIEEQFYIVWPLLLYFAWKWRFKFLILAVTIAAISFAANISFRHSDPIQDFYSPLTRLWELLMGSILAYLTLHKINIWDKVMQMLHKDRTQSRLERLLRNAQSVLGTILIGIAVLLVSKESVFPGWWALLPTVGTYLIISAGQHAWLNRAVLSHRIIVWLGLISYPLYLWHWQLLSFARITESKTPSSGIRFAAIALSLVLAWLTYRLIEHPIRFGKQSHTKIIALMLLMVVLTGIGYATYMQDGLRQRVSVRASVERTDELKYAKHWAKWSLCPNEGESKGCRILDPSRAPDIALIGDSHAGHLASGLAELYGHRSENIIVRLRAGCIPFFEMELDGQKVFSCEGGLINNALEEAITSTSIKSVILSSYALLMIQGNRGDSSNGLDSNGYVNNISIETVKRNADVFKKAMHFTLNRLVSSGKKIFFIVDTPELYFDPTECIALRPVVLPGHKLRTSCAIDKEKFEERNADYHRIVAEARAAFTSVKFINSYEYLCDKELCYGLIDGELMYQTRDHLTLTGSRYLISKIAHELH
jgi:peptidoglycan/LPS O-acetylase OafA/YrhL